MSQTLIPMKDRVLIKYDEESNPSSLLHIPKDVNWERVMTGEVIVTGPECKYGLKAGARVVMGLYTGVKLQIDKEEFVICKEDEIQAVVVGDTKVLSGGA